MADSTSSKTYLYLRLGVLSLAFFLAASLLIEIFVGDSEMKGSISAYYYTAVRSVFVGTLTAMGLCLIVIKGRDDWGEDMMLNLAGMCAPVVAMVPTPLEDDPLCLGRHRCVPADFVPGVENNVEALLVVGVIGLLIAARTVRRDKHERADLIGFGVSAVSLAAFTIWFVVDEDSFLLLAHYFTAVPMFGLIVAVAVVNAARVDEFAGRGMDVDRYRTAYRVIAGFMSLVIACAILIAIVKWQTGSQPTDYWVFAVEAALLLAFSAFWIVQTVQYKKYGEPSPRSRPEL